MLSTILFVWLGLRSDMPPIFYIMCGAYFVFAMIRAAFNGKRQ